MIDRFSMTYYRDLSLFTYWPSLGGEGQFLNVGWLSGKMPFARGETSERFRDELFRLVQSPDISTCGYHACELDGCAQKREWGLTEFRHGVSVTLGDSIVVVEGEQGVSYAAPDLVYHYVARHSYQPPESFVDAVLAGRSNEEDWSARRDYALYDEQ